MKRASHFVRVAAALLLATALCLTTACQNEREAARRKLDKMGVAMTPAELIRASGAGQENIVRLFIEAGYDLNVSNISDGRTPLTAAAIAGRQGMVDLLLENGAEINRIGPHGNTALMLAVDAENVPLAAHLLERGASTIPTNLEEFRVLELATFRANPELVRLLAPKSRAQLNRALHVGCVVADEPTVRALLENGADVNAVMLPTERTPIMMAAEHGKLDVAEVLLEYRADLSARDRDGKTAMMLAIENRYNELSTLLAQKLNDPEYQPLSVANAPRIDPRDLIGEEAPRSLAVAMGDGEEPALPATTAPAPASAMAPAVEPGEAPAVGAATANQPLPGPDAMPADAAPATGGKAPMLSQLRQSLDLEAGAAQPAASIDAATLSDPVLTPLAMEGEHNHRVITADGFEPGPGAGAVTTSAGLPLRLRDVHREVLPLRFSGIQSGAAVVEVGGKRHVVRRGREIPGVPYRVVRVRSKRGMDKMGEAQDRSTLYLEHTATGEQLTISGQGGTAESPSTGATLALDESGRTLDISRGEPFSLPGEPSRSFTLEDVRTDQVVLQEVETGRMYTVGR